MHIKLLRQNWVSDNNLLIANKSNCEKLCFCFEMKILYFQGIQIDVLSMVEVTKHVQPKIFDRKLLQLWFIQAPISLSTHTNWYTSSAGKISSVGCSYSIYLSRYSLIFTHPGENKFKNSCSTHSEYPHMECTNVLSLLMLDKCGIDEDLHKQLCFPVTAQPDWLMCIPIGWRKTFLKCYTSFHLIGNSAICSDMWDDM